MPAPLVQKKDFRDSNANSTKTAYYSQKGFAVHGWFSLIGSHIMFHLYVTLTFKQTVYIARRVVTHTHRHTHTDYRNPCACTED